MCCKSTSVIDEGFGASRLMEGEFVRKPSEDGFGVNGQWLEDVDG